MQYVVVRTDAVADSLEILRQTRIHETFAGYLAVTRTAAISSGPDLHPGFRDFFETFLKVPGGPPRKPYLLPFASEPRALTNRWFNQNVAGSYAPSSLRPVSPFLKVVEIEGAGSEALYRLRDEHWIRAKTHLTYGQPVPVVPLACFLLRDIGFPLETKMIDIIGIFRGEFGFARDQFDQLFAVDDLNDAWLTREEIADEPT